MRLNEMLFALALAAPLCGCSTIKGFFGKSEDRDLDRAVADDADEAEKKPASGRSAPKASRQDEQELKMARLWARVDELEEESMKSREHIRVLEKGMLLGLVPEELKKGEARGGKAGAKDVIVKEALADLAPEDTVAGEPAPATHKKRGAAAGEKEPAAVKEAGTKSALAATGMSAEETESYQAGFAAAHDYYRAGRYGLAIAEFDKLGKAYGNKIPGGVHKYWIGKSWMGLKEYNTARQIFTDFIAENGSSPWLPRAKLELGRVEWRLGLQDSAVTRFREITQTYPYEDAAEMAKMELENLGKTL